MRIISQVVFIGSKKLGLEALKTIWKLRPEALRGAITFDDTHDSRSALSEITEFCFQAGIQLNIASNRQDAEEKIKSLDPDLCLVVCWYWLLSDSLIQSIPYGAIGVHNSLLPKYRGGSPLVWAIINGEDEVGFSIFSLASSMDAGEIWLQEKVTLTSNDTIGSALQTIENRLLDSLNKYWCSVLDGGINPAPQNHQDATYCAQRIPDDGKIDWTLSAERIFNFIRAQTFPYPGAFTIFEGQRIYILQSQVFSHPYSGRPGQIAMVNHDKSIVIVCGNCTAIVVEKAVINGNELPAASVFPSIRIRLL